MHRFIPEPNQIDHLKPGRGVDLSQTRVTNLLTQWQHWQLASDFSTNDSLVYLDLALGFWLENTWYLISPAKAQTLVWLKKCATNQFISLNFLNELTLKKSTPCKLALNSLDPLRLNQSDSIQSSCVEKFFSKCYFMCLQKLHRGQQKPNCSMQNVQVCAPFLTNKSKF